MGETHETPLDRTPLWTLDDLCAKLHVSRATVHTWRKRGTGPRAYRIGRHLMFDQADVAAWLAQRADDPARSVTTDDDGSGW